ncbi:carbon-nitrogen hydrolase family protein [Homoserinimonas sp. OAct 916]|uniref:carbon-nitrogen hydrolase family protein n=1 Tax=Homoserinimonas sp. OAct 916 TaxID=2211450 RepID=UPI000DBE070F|nr:carbon-nitrogen hydrolase family protein [Homoserinimonas sp. OAct 916]
MQTFVSSSGSSVGVAVAQFAPGPDTTANLDQVTQLATAAALRGAALVVFPEYTSYFNDPMGDDFKRNAQPLDGPFVDALTALARRLDIHIVAGLLEATDDDRRFANTAIAVDGTGLLATYRKLHLYDAFGQKESDWVLAGEIAEPETFRVGEMTVGMQTCYDLRFPEVSRRLVDAGADLFVVPSEWVRGPLKEAHWRTLVTARALENTVYIAASDQAPPIGVGNSLIVDPMGVCLASIGEAAGVAVAWVDQRRIAEVRRKNPALTLRRFRVEPA